jgi:hypothetical protein
MVKKSLDTGNKVCDSYFAEQFDASTGQWIRKHPELDKIADLYVRFYKPTV